MPKLALSPSKGLRIWLQHDPSLPGTSFISPLSLQYTLGNLAASAMSRDQELENIKMCINQNTHKILLTGKIIFGLFLRHINKELPVGIVGHLFSIRR
jgi:hypothetical protein